MKEAHSHRDFELLIEGEVLDYGVTEADIANADPQVEFEDAPVQEADNTVNPFDNPVTVVDDPVTEEPQE